MFCTNYILTPVDDYWMGRSGDSFKYICRYLKPLLDAGYDDFVNLHNEIVNALIYREHNISSPRRNSVLADLFERMNLMERRESGLKKIIEADEFEENCKIELKPEFRSTEIEY